jgi:exosortase/archaeosortase family protein
MTLRVKVALRIVIIVAVNLAMFVLFQHDARVAETWMAAGLAGLVGPGRIHIVASTLVEVTPAHHSIFLVIVTPSCSSISSVCSLFCLASLLRGIRRVRLAGALLVSVATIVVGNVLRIAGSLAVGLVAGEASLVLFHDWVGSTFAFIYTLLGFIVLLYMLLPSNRQRRAEALASA